MNAEENLKEDKASQKGGVWMSSGEYLMLLRIDQEISLRELERKTKISYINIAEIEKGKIIPTKEQLKEIFEELKISEEEKKKFYILQKEENNNIKNNYSMFKRVKEFIKNLIAIYILQNQEKNDMKNNHCKYKNINKLKIIEKVILYMLNIFVGCASIYVLYEIKNISTTIYFIYFLFIFNMAYYFFKKTLNIKSKQLSYKDEKEFRDIEDKKEYFELQQKKEKIVDKILNYMVIVATSGIFIGSETFLKLNKERFQLVAIVFLIIEALSITGFDFYMNDIDIFEKKLGVKNKFQNTPFISFVRIFGYQMLTFFIIVVAGIFFMEVKKELERLEEKKQKSQINRVIKEKELSEELNSLNTEDKEKVLKFINNYIKNQ